MKYFNRPLWYLSLLAVAAAVMAAAIVAAVNTDNLDGRAGLIVVSCAIGLFLVVDFLLCGQSFDRLSLGRALRWTRFSKFRSAIRNIPGYRFVDMYHASERLAASRSGAVTLDLSSDLPLFRILNEVSLRRMKKPVSNKFAVGPDEHQWFPVDRFWIVSSADGGRRDTIVRLRLVSDDYRGTQIYLEVATSGSRSPEELIDSLTEDALKHSIYRGQVVRVQTGEGIRDDIGTEVYDQSLRLSFSVDRPVGDEDIILDDKIRDIFQRNVFSFHQLRERLAKYGIPQRRGLLLYGPPGTGKTYACRYMYSQLEGVTALIVTGQSLLRLKSVCELARMLQPSLLVLEDVDLVFSERELNPNSTSLGDMLDELDGFESDDAIIVVLTTNAIERVERAIKDRPGRISQCVYMAPPTAPLRHRYLERFLRNCDTAEVSLDEVVRLSHGASQAFLKEMVFRAIQVAVERSPADLNGDLSLRTEDFRVAIEEMTSQTEKAAASIIGLAARP